MAVSVFMEAVFNQILKILATTQYDKIKTISGSTESTDLILKENTLLGETAPLKQQLLSLYSAPFTA